MTEELQCAAEASPQVTSRSMIEETPEQMDRIRTFYHHGETIRQRKNSASK